MLSVCAVKDAACADEDKNPPMNEGEKIFRAMEDKILNAETVQVSFQGQVEAGGDAEHDYKGTFAYGGKNKVRMSFNASIWGPRADYLVVSDGEDWQMTNPRSRPEGKKCPDQMSVNLLRCLTCYSTSPMRLIFPLGGEEKIARGYGRSDFQFIRKEKVNGQDAVVVTYKMQYADHRRFTCTIWIDEASSLPIKRVTNNGEGQQEGLVEVFTNWKLGEELPENHFKLEK